ncbi:MAG TPA: hypothetical protein ENN18_05975 [Proteobacteria bacterium]|nr:hypothetical protein [Pseudomonadota bacterium]
MILFQILKLKTTFYETIIFGEKKKPHVIDPQRCIKCGICYSICKREAIRVK